MKRKFNLFLCLCMALVLCMSVFAGCGNNPPPEGGGTGDEIQCELAISESEISLNVNESKQLTATTNNNSLYVFTWSSSDKAVATVSDGLVTAVGGGVATVTVGCRQKGSTTTLETKTCKVTVNNHKVNLDRTAALIDAGETVTVTADVEGGDDPIAWTSEDPSVATVANGVITGHKTGITTIKATSGNVHADCRITVVNRKSVAPANNITLTTLLASPTWASDNTEVATVTDEGVVTGVALGTATVTATAGNDSESFIVTVTNETVDGAYTLERGVKADAAKAPGVWNYLTESEIVTISDIPTYKMGILTADITNVGESGKNFFYFRYQPDSVGSKYYKVHLYIWAGDEGIIEINSVYTDIHKGANKLTVDYTSNNTSAGDPFQFKFHKATSYIIAPYFEECAPEAKLTLDKTAIELLTVAGSNTATITPTYEDGAVFEWASSNPSVATVADGVVTAVGAGTATITCSSGGKSATCEVTVRTNSVTLSKTFVTLYDVTNAESTDKSVTLTATASDATAITWSSSDSETVTVNNGVITGVKKGWAIVTATSESGASCDCVVFVTEKPASYSLVEGFNASTITDTSKPATESPNKPGVLETPGVWCWSAQGSGTVYDNGVLTKTFGDNHKAVSGNDTFMLRFMPPEYGTWKVTLKLKITNTGAADDATIKAEFKGTGGTGNYTVAELAEGVVLTNEFTASAASGTFFQLKINGGIAANVPAVIEVSEISFVKVA